MNPSRHSLFEPRRGVSSSPQPEPDAHGLAELRVATTRSRRRFVIVNAAGWLVAGGAPTIFGMPGDAASTAGLKVGVLLLAAQSCLLLVSSTLFDRAQLNAHRRRAGGRETVPSAVRGEDGR